MIIDMEATSLRFAAAARTLGEVARAAGLIVPGFRSPPRVSGVDRTIKRTPRPASAVLGASGPAGHDVTVSVRIKDRPWVSVLADMIDGVLVANELTGATAGAARTVMWAAVEDDLASGSGTPTRRRRVQRHVAAVPAPFEGRARVA